MNNTFIKNAKNNSKNIKINRLIKTYLFINRFYKNKNEIVR